MDNAIILSDNQKLIDELTKERNELLEEITKLRQELALTVGEKDTSARLGLQLLDEKAELQKRLDELEPAFEQAKQELAEITRAYVASQTHQKASEHSGIEHEERLLKESAMKEASFTSALQDVERELKQVRAELQRVRDEKERLQLENAELAKVVEIMDQDTKSMRCVLKEMKVKEDRMQAEFSELEDENVNLQKSIMHLRKNLTEFEGAKHEVLRLKDELEVRKMQIEEYITLKNISDKQVQDVLDELTHERELKHELKKKLDERMKSDELRSNLGRFQDLASGYRSDGDDTEYFDEETSAPLLNRFEDDLLKSRVLDSSDPNSSTFTDTFSQPSSLFGEIHLSEIKKLEKNLEQVEKDKCQAIAKYNETQAQFEQAQKDLANQKDKCTQIIEYIKDLVTSQLQSHSNAEDLIKACKHEEVQALVDTLVDFYQASASGQLKSQVLKLELDLKQKNQEYECLKADLSTLNQIAETVQTSMTGTHDEMSVVMEELSALYYQACNAIGETPNRVLQTHVANKDEQKRNEKIAQLRTRFSKDSAATLLTNFKSDITDTDTRDLVEIVKETLKQFKATVESLIEKSQQPKLQSLQASASPLSTPNAIGSMITSPSIQAISELLPTSQNDPSKMTDQDIRLLIEKNQRLVAMYSTKCEQVATMRTVLNANKKTAEVALEHLKSKYQAEKQVNDETMAQMRKELRALKEDAATFASLRSMFANRLHEEVVQYDELQQQVKSLEEEKKTLNSLLRITITQKLQLTQRLDQAEMELERLGVRLHETSGSTQSPKNKPNQPGPGGRGKHDWRPLCSNSNSPNQRSLAGSSANLLARQIGRISSSSAGGHQQAPNLCPLPSQHK